MPSLVFLPLFTDPPRRRGMRRRHVRGGRKWLVFAPLLPRPDGPQRDAPRPIEGRRGPRDQRSLLRAQRDSRPRRGRRAIGLAVERFRKVIPPSPEPTIALVSRLFLQQSAEFVFLNQS